MNPLPPDPYLALGVSKTAPISEIRSAHRKLVLKCHPDKVQDEALKAVKQDEFQKVQQAYELLSDDTKRAQYDQHVKLLELRKEMGRGGPVGANVYYAEPRATSAAYRTKPTPPAYSARYDSSDEPKYPTPRRSSSYETKSKFSSKEEERRARKREEVVFEARRQLEREAELRARDIKREKDAHAERKKSRDKDRRKASVEKTTKNYIESESDSEDLRKPIRTSAPRSSAPRMKLADVVEMATKAARDESRRSADRGPEIVDVADRRREKTKAAIENAYRYMKASTRSSSERSAKIPAFVPDSPLINTIDEEDTTVRRSSGRTTRRSSGETPGSSRRPHDSSRSRESPRLSSKDKKRSDPRMEDDFPPSRKPTLSTQKSAPPEIPTRERPSRSHTMDEKYGSRGPPTVPLSRASTFHSGEKTQSRSSSRKQPPVVYESVSESESDSESDSPIPVKQPSPTRQRPPMVQKTSSYKIVRDINGQKLGQKLGHKLAERVHNLNLDDVHEEPRERSPSPRRPDYPRASTSRPSNYRAPQSQNFYEAQPSPVIEREREPPRVQTVRPGARETQSYNTASRPSIYDSKIKVNYSPPISREDITFSPQEFSRRGSDPDRFANYPAVNQSYKREEVVPSYRKAAYPVS